MKSFKCPKCGFFFSLAADWESMSKEEYREVTECPCGAQMKEVDYSANMVPKFEV